MLLVARGVTCMSAAASAFRITFQAGILGFDRIGLHHQYRPRRRLVHIEIDRVAGAVERLDGAPALSSPLICRQPVAPPCCSASA